MKILILGFLTLSFMTRSLDIEKLLYKHIDQIQNALPIHEGNHPSINSYVIKGDYEYLGEQYKDIYISTDKNKIIQNFSFGIIGRMNRQFYDKMITEYGEPDEITKKDNITTGKPSISRGITSMESTYTLKECTFEEEPLYIIWNKEGYTVKVLLKQEQRTTIKSIFITIGNVNL
ncbi:hypothetical protein ATE84_1107 [Aquimarina sp. MAR_2010_214]|uniref:hypothetical protein n=1 Tax=Aquimarina sp. MAR_2010_214 TaxID=1250026 RepID=UPI000CCAC56A|nr:hypothetical protein [Aquimarina sp. MAR_2010_214]PKV49091.1 hypothetical protein ATE84_1107 [Aquimarina sp. MAR_2010_214]